MPTGCPVEAGGALAVEVCIAWPRRALRIALRLPVGATVGDALRRAACDPGLDVSIVEWLRTAAANGDARSGAREAHPGGAARAPQKADERQAMARSVATGVFGKVRPPDWPLCDGDRVEVYRPLTVDPKAARRRRARRRASGPTEPGSPQ